MNLMTTSRRRRLSLFTTAGPSLIATTLLVTPTLAHDGEEPHDHGAGKDAPTPAPYVVEAGVEAEDDGPAPAPPPERAPASSTAKTSEEDLHERPSNLPRQDWRRSQRRKVDEETDTWFDPYHFYFELRFGMYSPQIDDDGLVYSDANGDPIPRTDAAGDPIPGTTQPLYETFFGGSPLFQFGLELDWLPLYIPWVGSVGPGFGWGWSTASGPSRDETGAPTESDTDLDIHALHGSVVFRLDGLLREATIPIVPYGKFGFGWALWEIDGPRGTAEFNGVEAKGTSYGLHYALGGAIPLNGFDRTAAVHLREETGIRYAYIFAEWYNQDLALFGPSPQLDVGTSSAVFGLALGF